jgi:hypothetical protein
MVPANVAARTDELRLVHGRPRLEECQSLERRSQLLPSLKDRAAAASSTARDTK